MQIKHPISRRINLPNHRELRLWQSKHFHHENKLGGTVYESTQSSSFFQGIDPDLVSILTLDLTGLCEKPDQVADEVPTMTNLFAAESMEDIENLVVGATTTYKPRNFVPITPFLLKTVNESILKNDGSAKHLLLSINSAICTFDTIHEDNDDYVDKAKTTSKDIICQCYLASKKSESIKPIPTIGCSSIMVMKAIKSITNQCLGQKNTESSQI